MIKNYRFTKNYRGPMGTFEEGKTYPLDTNMGKMLTHACVEDDSPVPAKESKSIKKSTASAG